MAGSTGQPRVDVGIDTGGTFTDLVTRDGRVAKVPSSGARPGEVMRQGLARLAESGFMPEPGFTVVHGTTIATNALLTGDTTPVGLIMTRGFRDVVRLGRQARPDLYALHPEPAFEPPSDRLVGEVDERLDANGKTLRVVDPEEAKKVGRALVRRGAGALCVCLINSYRNPLHERQVARAVSELGVPVVTSTAIVREFREFERFVTAWSNAGLVPLLVDYLARVGAALKEAGRTLGAGGSRLRIMQSDGSTLGVTRAGQEPVRLVLSGPAGGVVGAWSTARTRDRRHLVTLDMGGTSTDVALLAGSEPRAGRCEVAGRPLLVPVLDVHTVGAGGGSIARRDRGGALRVGPESAGARPGPAGYGHGGPATVTDAHLALGRVPEQAFLDGGFPLDRDAAREAVTALANDLDLDVDECALGILRIAEATMERALRTISLERGHDPREFSLVAFGGAGGLHAARLARSLEMREVVVPPNPGLLSAQGMLGTAVGTEISRTVLGTRLEDVEADPERHFGRLVQHARSDCRRDGLAPDETRIERTLDLRYRGQSFELEVPLGAPGRSAKMFASRHRKRYGFVMDEEVEVVNLRVRAMGPTPRRRAIRVSKGRGRPAPRLELTATFDDGPVPTPVYHRSDLRVGPKIDGPAVVIEYSATTVVPPGFSVTAETTGCLVVRDEEGR